MRLSSALSSHILKTSGDGDSTVSLGRLLQWLFLVFYTVHLYPGWHETASSKQVDANTLLYFSAAVFHHCLCSLHLCFGFCYPRQRHLSNSVIKNNKIFSSTVFCQCLWRNCKAMCDADLVSWGIVLLHLYNFCASVQLGFNLKLTVKRGILRPALLCECSKSGRKGKEKCLKPTEHTHSLFIAHNIQGSAGTPPRAGGTCKGKKVWTIDLLLLRCCWWIQRV